MFKKTINIPKVILKIILEFHIFIAIKNFLIINSQRIEKHINVYMMTCLNL